MKKTQITLFVLILLLLIKTQLLAQPCKEVVAYYPNWQWYDRNHLVEPASIDYSKYTIINYSFFSPQANGDINQIDVWADENLLFGQHDWVNGGYLPNTSLIDLAHSSGVKVLVSIGGWTLSNNFPGIATDSIKRTNFASECVRLINTYGFDGIDMDWEYPGYAEHNGTSADGINFTLLLQEIRDSIDAYGISISQDMLLTSCFSADPAKMAIIEWSNLVNIIDMFNIMTYDFFGTFSSVSNHNSPLYAPSIGDPDFNINSAFMNITQIYGVPASMVNIGVAFYGRSVTGCTGLHQTHSGSGDGATFWEDEGMPLYYNVLKNMSLFTSYWDNQAQVPYLLGNSINTFVSYDDEQSVALKAEYAINHGARGVIIWEMTGDYIETSPSSGVISGTPLVDTLNQVLCSITTHIQDVNNNSDIKIAVYPNPANMGSLVTVKCYSNNDNPIYLKILSIEGQPVFEQELIKNNFGLSSNSLTIYKTGIYFLYIYSDNEINIKRLIVI